MKALVLNGSPRPIGNTSNIILEVLEKLEKEGIEAEQIQLYAYQFTPCNDCRTCEIRGDCRCMDMEDGTNEILDKMREADIIILASPAYCSSATAVMRSFLEKAGLILDKGGKPLRGKIGAAFTVSEHDGAETAYLELVTWLLRRELFVVGSSHLPVFRALNSPAYEDDEYSMKGLDRMLDNIVLATEKFSGE